MAPGTQKKKKKAKNQSKKTAASASGIRPPAPHAPVSCSRFDKIDTDSDEEEPPHFCRGHQGFPPMDSMEYVRGGDGAASDDSGEYTSTRKQSEEGVDPGYVKVTHHGLGNDREAGKPPPAKKATLPGIRQGFWSKPVTKGTPMAKDDDSDDGPPPLVSGSSSGSDDESGGPPSLGPESDDEDEMPPLVPEDQRPGANASDSDDEPPSLESDGEADIPVFTNAKREDVRSHARFARPDLMAMSQQGSSEANGVAKEPAAKVSEKADPPAKEADKAKAPKKPVKVVLTSGSEEKEKAAPTDAADKSKKGPSAAAATTQPKPRKENVGTAQNGALEDYPGLQDNERPVERYAESVRLKAMSQAMADKLRGSASHGEEASSSKSPSSPAPETAKPAAAKTAPKKGAPASPAASSSRAGVDQTVADVTDEDDDDMPALVPTPKAKKKVEPKKAPPAKPKVDEAKMAAIREENRQKDVKRQEEKRKEDQERIMRELLEAEEREKQKKRLQEEKDQAKRDKRKQKAQRAKEAKEAKAVGNAGASSSKLEEPETPKSVPEESEASSSNPFNLLELASRPQPAGASQPKAKASKATSAGEGREQTAGVGPSRPAAAAAAASPLTVAQARGDGGAWKASPMPKPLPQAYPFLIAKVQNAWDKMELALHTKSIPHLTAAIALSSNWLQKQGKSGVFNDVNVQLEKKLVEAKTLVGDQPEAAAAFAFPRPSPATTPAPAAVRPVPVSGPAPAPPQMPYNPMQARPPQNMAAALPGQGGRGVPPGRPHPGMPPAFVRQGGVGGQWEQPALGSDDPFGGVPMAGTRPLGPPAAAYNPMQASARPPPPPAAPRLLPTGGRQPMPAAVRAPAPPTYSPPPRPQPIDFVKPPAPFEGMAANPGAGGEDNDRERELECCICMEWPSDRVIQPCGHNCVCQGCADMLQNTTKLCPICRVTITEILVVSD